MDMEDYKVFEENEIYVPRMHGYRFMEREQPITDIFGVDDFNFKYEAYEMIKKYFMYQAAEQLLATDSNKSRSKKKKFVYRYVFLYTFTDMCVNKYFNRGKSKRRKSHYASRPVKDQEFHWERFHGKLKNKLKLLYKQLKRKHDEQKAEWNKYVGKNVLYVYARVGGGNWETCKEEIVNNPRLLSVIEDSFDNTYCELYFDLGNTSKLL